MSVLRRVLACSLLVLVGCALAGCACGNRPWRPYGYCSTSCCAPCCPQPCCGPCAAPCADVGGAVESMPSDPPAPAVAAAVRPVAGSLFERLGGMAGIEAIVDDFLPRNAQNATVNANAAVRARMEKSDVAEQRRLLVELLCQMTGGPCTYSGKDMKTAHAGLGITEDEWDAAGKDFFATLDALNVGQKERVELLKLVIGVKGDVVGQ